MRVATWARKRFDHQTDHQTLPVATRSKRRSGPPIGEAGRQSEKPVARQGRAVTHVSAASRTLSSKAGDVGEPCPEVRLGRQRRGGGDPQAQPSLVRGEGYRVRPRRRSTHLPDALDDPEGDVQRSDGGAPYRQRGILRSERTIDCRRGAQHLSERVRVHMRVSVHRQRVRGVAKRYRIDGTPIALHRVPLGNARLLFTPEEVAQALAIGRSKVYDLLRSEELSSIRIGGSRRILVSALHEFVDRLRSNQSAQRQ